MLKVILQAVASCAVFGAQFANAQPARDTTSIVKGTSFTYTVTSNKRDTSEAKWWNGKAIVRMSNGTVRMDYMQGTALVCCIEENRSPMMTVREGWPGTGNKEDSGYLLMNSAASWYLVVIDRYRVFKSYNAENFALAVWRQGVSVQQVFTTGTFTFIDLGVGDKILGHATRHVRIATNFNVGTNTGNQWLSDRSDTTDIWLAFNTGADENSLVSWAETFGVGAYFNNPLLAEQRQSYLRQFGCKGIPLRMVTRIPRTLDGTVIDTVRADVTDLRNVSFDTSLFQAPNGYTQFGKGSQVQGKAGYGVGASDTVPRSQNLPANSNKFCR